MEPISRFEEFLEWLFPARRRARVERLDRFIDQICVGLSAERIVTGEISCEHVAANDAGEVKHVFTDAGFLVPNWPRRAR